MTGRIGQGRGLRCGAEPGREARAVGITESNLSLLKSGKVRGFRFSTLDAICKFLDCQPGDIMEYVPDEKPALKRAG